jgi:hypothetical protein
LGDCVVQKVDTARLVGQRADPGIGDAQKTARNDLSGLRFKEALHNLVVKDATAAFNPEGMEAAPVNSLLYAHASITTNELLAALPAPRAKHQAA